MTREAYAGIQRAWLRILLAREAKGTLTPRMEQALADWREQKDDWR